MEAKRIRTAGVEWDRMIEETEKVAPRETPLERSIYQIDSHGITGDDQLQDALWAALDMYGKNEDPEPPIYELVTISQP